MYVFVYLFYLCLVISCLHRWLSQAIYLAVCCLYFTNPTSMYVNIFSFDCPCFGGIFFHSSNSICTLALLFSFLSNLLFIFLEVCLVDSSEFDLIFNLFLVKAYSFLVFMKLMLLLFCLLETWSSIFILFFVTDINSEHST